MKLIRIELARTREEAEAIAEELRIRKFQVTGPEVTQMLKVNDRTTPDQLPRTYTDPDDDELWMVTARR